MSSPAAEDRHSTLHASGTLKGYFLTADGRLVIRSVLLSPQPNTKPTTVLYPLWASYYFTGSVRSSGQDLAQVKVFAGRNLLWQQKFAPPCQQATFPGGEGKFIGVPARDGMPLQVEVTWVSGRRSIMGLKPLDVDWGALPPLRVDWLDFLRIAEVRRLLRAKGDQIWKGFRADRVPFLLEGDRQWVLVDHPKPPAGFTRYQGKLPVPLSVHVGTSPPADLNPHAHVHGEVVRVNGVYTAALRYRPSWFALPEGMGVARSNREANERLAAMVHEAFHAWMLNVKPIPMGYSGRLLQSPSAETMAMRALETEVLSQAVHAEDMKEVKELVWDFFTLRTARRESDNLQKEAMTIEQRVELMEGLAYYVMAQAMRIAATAKQPSLFMQADPFFEEYEPIDPSEWLTGDPEKAIGAAVATERNFEGYAQVLLLDRLRVKWKEQVLKTPAPLEDLLAQAIGWTQRSAAERHKAIQQLKADGIFRQTVMGIRRQIEEFARTGSVQFQQVQKGQRVGLWIVASLSSAPLPSRTQLTQGNWLPGFQMNSGDALQISVQRLCWLSHRITLPQPIVELFIPLDPKKDLLWLKRVGRALSLKCQEVMIHAKNADLQVMPHNLRLQVQSNLRAQEKEEPKGSRPTMRSIPGQAIRSHSRSIERHQGSISTIGRAKWMLVPSILLVSATNVQAQIEGQTIEETATGLFEDAGTGQQQTLTLDLLNPELNPPGDWVTIDTETYLLHLDAYDDYSRLHELTLTDENGNVLDQVVADPPAAALHAVGLRIFGGRYRIQPVITASHVTTGPNKCTWTFVGGITFVPQPNLTLQATVLNGANTPATPLAGAFVRFYRSSRPNEGQTLQTDNNGVAILEVSEANDWMMEVRMGGSGSAWCSVRKGPYKMKGKTSGLRDSFTIYPHQLVEGKIIFQGQGIGDPSQVRVEALQGGNVVATGTVGTTANPDGSYTYVFPYPLTAGTYTVKATYLLTKLLRFVNWGETFPLPRGLSPQMRSLKLSVQRLRGKSTA